jgi:hypothetical protein
MKAYKGFNKGLTCRGFQFEEGKEYTHEGDIKLCEQGFHFCENPLDILDFYDLTTSEFAIIEATGEVKSDEKKSVTDKIKISAKIDLSVFIKASVNFLFEKTSHKSLIEKITGHYSQLASSGDSSQLASSGHSSKLASSGDSSKLASSGDSSKLASSGHYSQLASSGHYSQLEINGADSVGVNIGIEGTIKGTKGNWITLAEYDNNYKPICVKSVQIDGIKIKADTFYILKNGKFTQYDN